MSDSPRNSFHGVSAGSAIEDRVSATRTRSQKMRKMIDPHSRLIGLCLKMYVILQWKSSFLVLQTYL